MTITFRLLEAYVKCPTKCWLRATNEQPSSGSYAGWAQAQNESYRAARIHELLSETCQGGSVNSPSVDDLRHGSWQLATDVLAQTKNLESHIPAVERTSAEGPGKRDQLVPLRFVCTNKVEKDAKLLLAFDAIALAELGCNVRWGKIIHGDEHSVAKVSVSALERDVQGRIEETAALLSRPSPPDLQLIRHCPECEFQARCRQKALEKDDLSLLSGMSQKERSKLHKKGIFTVTQLSYTFRPRRRPKSMRDRREKYLHTLRALAVREKKIYIVGSPELKIEGTPVYLDVEGLPDRNSYYLIGMRLGNGNSAIQHSLWANSINDEERIWKEFLAIMANVNNPVLVHYGNYETRFLKCMRARYGLHLAGPVTSKAIGSSVNLLSLVFGQIYFPTLSNSLKDVGLLFGAKWTGPITSGLESISYRLDWELSRDPQLKTALLNYNREDSAALEIVTSNLIQIIREADSREDVEFPFRPKKVASSRGGEVHSALQSILRSAQFRYSRSRIKISASKADRSVPLKEGGKSHTRWKLFPTIRGKIVWLPRRRVCPRHPGHRLVSSSKTAQHSVIDLKFSKTGCRKTAIRYTGRRGYCFLCHESHVPRRIHLLGRQRFGRSFQAWVIYQRLALRLSYRLISRATFDLFSEELPLHTVAQFVEKFSQDYRRTEDLLLHRMLNGPVIHLDETKINILGADQYVWVLTDNSRVIFRLQRTRETDFLKPLLADFKGTVVSDFYGGYDALPCRQQKCLVHLIRDLNDDLWKNPFDDNFERFTLAVRDLLSPILEDVQRFGLKACHLRKHRHRVDRFYREEITGRACAEDTTARYRKRFERYKQSLFSFIEDDNVPWHNNAAERAIRHLAVQRKISGAFGERGARQYLRLLGIAQTCRFQQKSLLGFLLSESPDVDEYRESGRVHPDWMVDCWDRD